MQCKPSADQSSCPPTPYRCLIPHLPCCGLVLSSCVCRLGAAVCPQPNRPAPVHKDVPATATRSAPTSSPTAHAALALWHTRPCHLSAHRRPVQIKPVPLLSATCSRSLSPHSKTTLPNRNITAMKRQCQCATRHTHKWSDGSCARQHHQQTSPLPPSVLHPCHCALPPPSLPQLPSLALAHSPPPAPAAAACCCPVGGASGARGNRLCVSTV